MAAAMAVVMHNERKKERQEARKQMLEDQLRFNRVRGPPLALSPTSDRGVPTFSASSFSAATAAAAKTVPCVYRALPGE